MRGMKAILLADNSVELFSTDEPASCYTALVNEPVVTGKCRCIIKDVACLICGNVVGYAVIIPCRPCLDACNNGHYFMFNSNTVYATERLDQTGTEILQWGDLPTVDDETDMKTSNSASLTATADDNDIKYLR
jgi:hypothetical protein